MSSGTTTQTHTPGPWTLVVVTPENNDQNLAGWAQIHRPHHNHLETTLADARLIAAAPEMARILADAVKVLDAQGIVYGDTGDDTEPLDVLREARALLARIEKGTP